jgi:hypothetical protein
MVVLFPAPFGPSRPTISPRPTVNEILEPQCAQHIVWSGGYFYHQSIAHETTQRASQ